MNKKYNQFIRQYIADTDVNDKEKLVTIAGYLNKEFGFMVHREPITMFDKYTGKFDGHGSYMSQEQFEKYRIHVPDLLFYNGSNMWIFEIDGPIHNASSSVAKRDENRKFDYEFAKINYKVFNELEILMEQGIKSTRSANAWELKDAIFKYVREHVIT